MRDGTKVRVINTNDVMHYNKIGKVVRNMSIIPSNQQYIAVEFKDGGTYFFVERELKVC